MRDLSRWVTLSVAPALVFACATTASAQVLSEADAVARALASSPQLRSARTRPTQVAAEERARRAALNPSVTLQQEDAGGVRDRFLLVEQPFSVSGRRGLLAKAATHAVAASEASVRDLEHAVRRDTRVAYAQCAGAIARQRVLRDGLATLEQLTERLRAREQAGEASAFDRLRAEREHADVVDDRRSASADVAYWRAQLAGLLGEPDGGRGLTLETQGPTGSLPDLDQAIHAAQTRRPALEAAAAEIERLRFEREAASRLRWPSPSVSGGWKQTADGHRADSGYAIALGVAVPLFARGTAETSALGSALTGAEAARDGVLRAIEAEVRGAHARASEGRARVTAYGTEALARSRELVAIATLAYDEGELGILELLDAHRTLLSAERRAVDLQVDARIAAVLLDYATANEVVR